jgi:dienelactone hydrolase
MDQKYANTTMRQFLLISITGTALLLSPPAALHAADPPKNTEAQTDPLAPILKPHLKSTVEVFLDHYREERKYVNADFPMTAEKFAGFKNEIVTQLASSLGIEDWVVRLPAGKASPIARLFEDRLVETTSLHGVTVEIHAVTLEPTGLVVPMALCLPNDNQSKPVPGVCVFSGHTGGGLHDLVVNLNSYQQGVAIRLAQAGFASIAVEKIDTGYLSRNGVRGNDENVAATLMLSWGSVLRSHQLRACLAATEILAGHSRVDQTRIGATGVSLGGWLSVQTAMLNDRIAAVADFGRKTRSVSSDMTPQKYKGQADLCHIIPGMLRLSDRNLMPVVLAPKPMLAGHGRKDTGSHLEHTANFRDICEAQYAALDASANYSYLIHDGGDTMPSQQAIAWFKKQFAETGHRHTSLPARNEIQP